MTSSVVATTRGGAAAAAAAADDENSAAATDGSRIRRRWSSPSQGRERVRRRTSRFGTGWRGRHVDATGRHELRSKIREFVALRRGGGGGGRRARYHRKLCPLIGKLRIIGNHSQGRRWRWRWRRRRWRRRRRSERQR